MDGCEYLYLVDCIVLYVGERFFVKDELKLYYIVINCFDVVYENNGW